jgi:C-terminal processing protease CtpA/Prc
MDTRTSANPELERDFAGAPGVLRPEPAPAGITRFVHWAVPTTPVSDLADARVFVLTDFTASACEHLALALQSSGRGTLVGATTRGAGHFGGEQDFGDGRFQVWLPVGRTYVAATDWDWEGVGVAPDRAVAPADALNVVMAELGVAQSAASAEVSQPAMPMRVARAPGGPQGRPSYGIAMAPPRGGEQALDIFDVVADRPAAAAGLRAGDRIVSVNGTAVSQLAPGQFETAMRASPLTLGIRRGEEELSFTLTLGG